MFSRALSQEIQLILVPAGAEYRAVKQALKQVKNGPQAVAIPAGPSAARSFLENWRAYPTQSGSVLLVGLGGSLSAQYKVGDALLLEKVWNGFGERQVFECDRDLTHQIAARLKIATEVGVTCDHVITSPREKQKLGNRYAASLVDMESAAVIKAFSHFAVKQRIAVLRVISDDARHTLPDLSSTLSPDGSIRPISLALSFLRNPTAALRLIQGSLKALKALEKLTIALFL